MNDKLMSLFEKDARQLDKELRRRGIKKQLSDFFYDPKLPTITRERAIAEIIYKDAYDAGASICTEKEVKTTDYILTNHGTQNRYKVSLEPSQVRFAHWLKGQFFNVDFEEIGNAIDIGRI